MRNELFLSIDIEAGGPIPGKHPMLELGVAAYNIYGEVENTWQANIAQANWEMDSATMKWWHMPDNFKNFQRITEDAQEPQNAMVQFSAWLYDLSDNKQRDLVPVAYPAAFDYMFVYWYLIYYLGHSTPLSFSCLDVKTYVCAAMKTQYRKTSKKSFPKTWYHPNLPHTHGALDDALEQGWVFIQAHRFNLGFEPLKPQDFKREG